MKTILVLTDFTISADYVADYALQLAQKISANLLVCNIYEVPDEEKNTQPGSWTLRACEKNSIDDLGALVARLKTKLDRDEHKNSYKPEIDQYSQEGSVGQKLGNVIAKHEILLAIVSVHSKNHFTGLFEKDHTWDIIEQASFPVMVIPYQLSFKPFKMIAFATVMNYTDITVLESLSGLAKYSDAEILITNVTAEVQEESSIKDFFNQIPFKITYPKIQYHSIKGNNVANSLKQLCANIDIDLLVLVHSRRSFFQKLLHRGVTHKMTNGLNKPLLIFPCYTVRTTFSVF